ncbi:MAG: c-type cytochrome [Terriglobia bacterium]|nr:c-type cytochrome [Terriglobia bacterium]
MRKLSVILASMVVAVVLLYVGIVYLFMEKYRAPAPPAVSAKAPRFKAPNPEDAPPQLRPAVLLGYDIMMHTATYAPAYTGNKLNCSSCHFAAGLVDEGIPLVGVAATYPKYRKRTNYATDLVARTNECFERSMNGRAAPVTSREMQALQAYFAWISRGTPIYSDVPWLGVKRVQPTRDPDRANGQSIFAVRCALCHGADGAGTVQAPPLWGPQSFNDGAGMAKLETFASFVHANMPKGTPDLSVDQAYDVAAYVTKQPRPHFKE